jgi:hypothetical protein
VALSSARLREWLAAELSGLDLLVVQIDGIHISENLVLVAAIGIDGEGIKHPLALIEGATENAAVAQALIDNLIERGLDPAVPRLFIIDGSKALSRAIRRSFGRETAIQRCQIHKARNIMERLPKGLHASVRRALRQAWELDDAAKAERLIRNLAQRLEHEAPGVSGSLLEGLDEILTVTRADFDTPDPAGAGTSPSGSRTARRNFRVETLSSMRFIAHLPSQSSPVACCQLGSASSWPAISRTRGRSISILPA